MINPDLLWAGQHWPLTDDDHLFFVPAFQRIGKHRGGDRWRDHYPSLMPLKVQAPTVEVASAEERAWAHRVLSVILPDSYVEDYRPDAPLAPLGYAALDMLGRGRSDFGEDHNFNASGARPAGWWFSQAHWETFRDAVHYQNEAQKPHIELVDDAARWLFNRVIRGEIRPLAQHIRGGDWQTTTVNDWRMPDADRLRGRIRRCTMVPGQPSVPGGSHWVFISIHELEKALANQSDARGIEAAVKRHFAREYDAAQDGGQVYPVGTSIGVLDGNNQVTVEEAALIAKDTDDDREICEPDVDEPDGERAVALDASGRPLRGKQLAAFTALKGAFGSELGRSLANADRALKMRRWVLAQKPRPINLDGLPTKDKDLYRLFSHLDKKCFRNKSL